MFKVDLTERTMYGRMKAINHNSENCPATVHEINNGNILSECSSQKVMLKANNMYY